jgi:hypothetical protein
MNFPIRIYPGAMVRRPHGDPDRYLLVMTASSTSFTGRWCRRSNSKGINADLLTSQVKWPQDGNWVSLSPAMVTL